MTSERAGGSPGDPAVTTRNTAGSLGLFWLLTSRNVTTNQRSVCARIERQENADA